MKVLVTGGAGYIGSFLLDMVKFSVGVVHAQRMLFGGDVVAQNQIQFVVRSPAAGDGGNGVVGHAFGLCKDWPSTPTGWKS